jgi:serine/threonine-protein kinase RsbW
LVANCIAYPHNAGVQTPAKPNSEEERRETIGSDQPIVIETAPFRPAEPRIADSPPLLVRHADFEFPGILASVPEYRDQLMEFITQQPMHEDDQIDILVALQEALANAALHGCKDDPAKKILCSVTADPVQIVVSIRDSGPGFDLQRADPDKFEASNLSHGRGIALMRGLMTEVSFAHRGAEIILRKRLTPAS